MVRTAPATLGQATLQRPSRAKHANPCVVARNSDLGGELAHRSALDLDALERYPILGLQGPREPTDAVTGRSARLEFWLHGGILRYSDAF